jgi:SAM-dependent methyltransferase
MTAAPRASYAARTKYDEPGRAARYAERSRARDEEERRLVARALEGLPAPASVIDAPCGTGRMAAEFLSRGATVLCADLSPAMRAEAAARLAGSPGFLGVVPLDLEAPAPSDARADLVLCVRFLHHLPDAAARARVLAGLAAMSRRHVLVTFHHPVSVHHLARALRRVVTGRRGDRRAITVRRLAAEASAHGLRLVRAVATAPYRRDLWAALFEKT